MKVLLVALNSQYVHTNLAIRYLKAYTEDLPYECKISEYTINHRIEQVLEGVMLEKADVICFSTYIWNVNMVKDLTMLIKKINNKIEILYGGPEVSFDSKEFLKESKGDYIIMGEGEETFRQFIEYKLGMISSLEIIKGICFKDKNEIHVNEKRQNIDMNKLVFPYKEDEDLKNKIVYYEASRGCPFRCKYCLSSTDRNLRFLDVERVKKELQYFIDKHVKLVKFVDRTFNASHKFAMEIWSYLIENDNLDTAFHFEISADILRDEQFELLKNAREGLFQFEVGVQSTNVDTLKHINRMVDFHFIEKKVGKVKKLRNIKQHLDLIAGLPNEDLNSFKKSFNDVYELQPEEIQLGFLKLLKGAPMREEAEKWGMVYSHIPPYEILKTNSISYEELLILKKVEAMVDKYYNTGKFKNIINYFMKKFQNPFEFYYKLAMFFEKKGYFAKNISSAAYYNVFLDFNKELEKSNEELKEIIKYDYLCFNKKKWIPPFLKREINKKEIEKIKENLRESDENINFSKIHIEKFFIDIEKYLTYNIMESKESYIMFNEVENCIKFI